MNAPRSASLRSYALLATFAMAVLTLPLALGLANAIRTLDDVSRAQRSQAHGSLALIRDARTAIDAIDQWQRAAGQYHLLRAAEFAGPQRQRYGEFDAALGRLASGVHSPGVRSGIRTLRADAARLAQQLAPPDYLGADGFNALAATFGALHNGARTLEQAVDAQVEHDRAALDDAVEAAGARLRALAWALAPITLLLAAAFGWLLQRPVRRLREAIHRLGRDDLRPFPDIAGPADLAEFGREIDWLRRRLISLEEEKARFLGQMSHELKTPLASLREGVALLRDDVTGDLAPRQRAIVAILDESVEALERRILDLLNYRAAMRERDTAPATAQRIDDALARVVAAQKLALDAHAVTLATRLDAATLVADSARLELVLGNLLSNALRFSPAGGRIGVYSTTTAEGVTLDVCDQGPGVAADDRERVFEPFYRGKRQPAGALRGSGLGLSIVREALAAAGGRVELVERAPWSTCFRTHWPRT